jgi:hypothetical protein
VEWRGAERRGEEARREEKVAERNRETHPSVEGNGILCL